MKYSTLDAKRILDDGCHVRQQHTPAFGIGQSATSLQSAYDEDVFIRNSIQPHYANSLNLFH
eukprot:1882257-Amphidinium_carterae.1